LADIWASVNGSNTYDLMFAMAMGEPLPPLLQSARSRAATSFVLRRFRGGTVRPTPTPQEIRDAMARFPLTLLLSFDDDGQRLSRAAFQSDGQSYPYTVLAVAGADRQSMDEDFAQIHARLRFEIANERSTLSSIRTSSPLSGGSL
jgi:hypothetical protein